MVLVILIGGIGSGLANISSSVGTSPGCPVDTEVFMAEGEEDRVVRGADHVCPQPPGHASSLRGTANWSADFRVADPARREQARGKSTPTVVLEVQGGRSTEHGHGLARVDEIRAYAYAGFQELGLDADYAWEVLRCESDDFSLDVIYGPRTGSSGEIGIGQLKPNGGLLDDFYAQGYQDPWDPYLQIDYISMKVSQEGWWAWSCAH